MTDDPEKAAALSALHAMEEEDYGHLSDDERLEIQLEQDLDDELLDDDELEGFGH